MFLSSKVYVEIRIRSSIIIEDLNGKGYVKMINNYTKHSWSPYSVILIILPAFMVFIFLFLFTGSVSYKALIPV